MPHSKTAVVRKLMFVLYPTSKKEKKCTQFELDQIQTHQEMQFFILNHEISDAIVTLNTVKVANNGMNRKKKPVVMHLSVFQCPRK